MNVINLVKKMNNSMVGYLPIKVLEGLIGILTLKVYSTLFLPEYMGQYTIINTTVAFVFLILLGWVNQSVIRFSNMYSKDEKETQRFYSTIFISFFAASAAISALFAGGYLLFPSAFQDVRGIFLLTIFVFFSYGLSQVMMTYLLYGNRRGLNSILLLGAAAAKVLLTLLLSKTVTDTITAIFISHSVTDLTVSTIAMMASATHRFIRVRSFSAAMLKTFISYGFPLLGLSLMMSVLNISDRYIIRLYLSNREVGLYTQNYSIASSIFTLIMVGLSRGIYPKILNAWNNKDSKGAIEYLGAGVRYYAMIALPAALGLWLLCKPIASICLDEAYFSGSFVIGIVALGMFFSGLSEYYNRGWELTTNTKPILVNCFIVAVIKVLLNLVFIPSFGYSAAAYTTLATFVLYLLISMARGHKEVRCRMRAGSWRNILTASAAMTAAVWAMDYFVLINLLTILPIIFVAGVVYFGVLYLNGEIKDEFKRMRARG